MTPAEGGETVGALVRRATATLKAAGSGSPRLDARLLVRHCLGLEMEIVVGYPERRVAAAEVEALDRLVRRRVGREPMAYILGSREFWSLSFRVTPDVLVPRPESETLIESVLARIDDRARPLRILDLGTGSGCLLLALLSELPNAWGLGVDRSAAAVGVARANARALRDLAQRTAWLQGDWASSLAGRFDLVVANPPYVRSDALATLAPDVRDFEPRLALDGGSDGLGALKSLMVDLGRVVACRALVAFECGAGQAPAVADLLAGCGMAGVEIVDDLTGVGRCVVATAKDAPSAEKKAWKPCRSRLVSS